LTLAAIAVMVAVIGVLYQETIGQAVHTWTHSETYQFCLLVLPISLFIIWQRRSRVAQETPTPVFWPLLLLAPLGLLWLVADAIHLALGAQIAVLGMLQVLLFSFLGWRVYRILLFPLLFLWLLAPFGDSLTPYLMRLTTHLTALGLTLAGLDVTTDGNIVISEAGRVGIIEDCSALDFVIGNLVISLVFANLVFSKNGKRWIYVLAAVPVAILANNLRTTSVILITYWSDRAWDLLADHQLYGWLIFLLCVALQMACGARFMDPQDHRSKSSSTSPAAHSPSQAKIYAVLVIAVITIAIPPAYAALLQKNPLDSPVGSLCGPAWLSSGTAQQPQDWRPVFLGAQAELHAQQQMDDRNVDFYVAYYWRQSEGAELIGWPNAVYDGKTWHFLESRPMTIQVDERAVAIQETRLRGPQRERRLTWHWYWVDGTFVASPALAKLLQAKTLLLGGDSRAAAIVLSTIEGEHPEAARSVMQALLAQAPFLTLLLNNAQADGGDHLDCDASSVVSNSM
jgi:EpsI family protein